MARAWLLTTWIVFFATASNAAPRVPATMDFCGIRLSFTAAARSRLQQEVDKLTANAAYHQKLAERAALYMPFVKDAFAYIGVPADLTIICVQESGLRGDAVSPSKAVGFWQLKDYTAEEMGLLVNTQVDERKHISRSSIAAAKYLFKKNLQFNNWVYAVIAYYEGGTGALPYVDADNFGTNNMTVDDNLHWYALRVIAHKIAFADVLEDLKPTQHLQARSTRGETSLNKLIQQSKLSRDEFMQYNLWAVNGTLPKGRPLCYFVPAAGRLARHEPDPHLDFFEKPGALQYAYAKPVPLKNKPEPKPAFVAPKPVATNAATEKLPDVTREAWYNHQFTFATGTEDLAVIAARTGLSMRKVRKYNPALPNGLLAAGTRVLLMPPKRVDVHVAAAGETIESIAMLYDHTSHKLARLNGLQYNSPVERGRKVYLRHARPLGEEVLRYKLPMATTNNASTPAEQVLNKPTGYAQQINSLPTSFSTNGDESKTEQPSIKTKSTATQQPMLKEGDTPQPVNTKPTAATSSTSVSTTNTQVANTTSSQPSRPTPNEQPFAQSAGAIKGNQQFIPPQSTNLVTSGVGNATQAGVANASSAKTVDTRSKKPEVPRYTTYTVAKGESLFGIAKKFGMTVDELRAVNKLSGYGVALGATLKVRAQ